MCNCRSIFGSTDSPALASAKRTLSKLQTRHAELALRLNFAADNDDDETAETCRAELLELNHPLREIRKKLANLRLPLLQRKQETYSELLGLVRADLMKTQRDLTM